MAIIKNYGFLWDRSQIYRGRGGDAGHLKGTSPGYCIADFREQIGVYVLYDANQKIVYVGQAGNGNATLFSRLKSHMDGVLSNRWSYFSWVGFRDVNDNGGLSNRQSVDSGVSGLTYSNALNEVEGILIEIIEPKLNKQSGKLHNATRYYQYQDDRLKTVTTNELLQEIQGLREQIGDG